MHRTVNHHAQRANGKLRKSRGKPNLVQCPQDICLQTFYARKYVEWVDRVMVHGENWRGHTNAIFLEHTSRCLPTVFGENLPWLTTVWQARTWPTVPQHILASALLSVRYQWSQTQVLWSHHLLRSRITNKEVEPIPSTSANASECKVLCLCNLGRQFPTVASLCNSECCELSLQTSST